MDEVNYMKSWVMIRRSCLYGKWICYLFTWGSLSLNLISPHGWIELIIKYFFWVCCWKLELVFGWFMYSWSGINLQFILEKLSIWIGENLQSIDCDHQSGTPLKPSQEAEAEAEKVLGISKDYMMIYYYNHICSNSCFRLMGAVQLGVPFHSSSANCLLALSVVWPPSNQT